MYVPHSFLPPGPDAAAAVVAAEPLALLLSNGEDVPQVSHVPVLMEEGEGGNAVVLGHLARANPHAKALVNGASVVVVFSGPHAYISPSWYVSPSLVPTWNYVAVHVHGRITLDSSRTANEATVSRLSDHFEADRSAPWQADFADPKLQAMLDHIVSFKVQVSEVQAKFKLSQNRPAVDRSAVHAALAEGTVMERALARLMVDTGTEPA